MNARDRDRLHLALAGGLGFRALTVITGIEQGSFRFADFYARRVRRIFPALILVLAAIGGSMVPRFLMPAWLQTVGWFTPHAWVIDAYQGILWRDAGLSQVYRAWGVLLAIGGAGLVLAQTLARRSRR